MAKERHTEHKIQNQNGQITERNSYGRDPYPPKAKDREGAVEAQSKPKPATKRGVLDLKAP